MTEAQWNSCTDPMVMLEFLRTNSRASDRKLRLFAVACSRRVWQLLDPLGRHAVAVAEQYADGQVRPEQLRAARLACRFSGGHAAWYAAATDPAIAARNAALSAQQGTLAESLAQAQLLRDVFGNPFRPLPSLPTWPESTVARLAQDIYEQRRFEDLGVLANALLDVGGTDPGLLAHLGGPGPHCRGCHALDAILGRT